MISSFNLRKFQQELRNLTDHIRPDPRPNLEMAEREHLHELFLRLIAPVYDYPALSVEEIVHHVPLRLSSAEERYLADRLTEVRKNHNLAVVVRDDEAVLLPLRPDFDPRKVPLAAAWTDGGFYTPKERTHSNAGKLRKLGLRDGVAGYASYRLLILNPTVGHAAWQVEPEELGAVTSSYEAEALAAQLALESLIGRLEGERHLPSTDQFHVVLFSDCQSLITALKAPPDPAEASAERLAHLRELIALFAGFYPQWEGRRWIKQRLGH